MPFRHANRAHDLDTRIEHEVRERLDVPLETHFHMDFSLGVANTLAAIAQKLLPDTMRPFVPSAGSIGNTHFVAVPFKVSRNVASQCVAGLEAGAGRPDQNSGHPGRQLDEQCVRLRARRQTAQPSLCVDRVRLVGHDDAVARARRRRSARWGSW